MTRTYAIRRLLEHGELTMQELVAITGWPYATVRAAIRNLLDSGMVEKEPVSARQNAYRLAE